MPQYYRMILTLTRGDLPPMGCSNSHSGAAALVGVGGWGERMDRIGLLSKGDFIRQVSRKKGDNVQ